MLLFKSLPSSAGQDYFFSLAGADKSGKEHSELQVTPYSTIGDFFQERRKMAQNFPKCFTAACDGLQAADMLCEATGLSKSRIKDAMQKGAVWLQKADQSKRRRLRRASTFLRKGDRLFFSHNAAILAEKPQRPELVADRAQYSVWNKPAGMLCQGTEYGDHTSLLRLVEQFFLPRRQVYLLHRLDREASGLVLIAHTKKAAALLSRLFKERKIDKRYLAAVSGKPGDPGSIRTIAMPLDGKEAISRLTVLSFDSEKNQSSLEICIETGRLHQIRRHLAGISHPIVGDQRYGIAAPEGLQLKAISLAFTCPLSGRPVAFTLEAP